MRAVPAEPARRLPVGRAGHAVPRLVRLPVDARDLVVGRRLGLVLRLERLEAQDVQVEFIGAGALKVAEFAAEGEGACYVLVRSLGVRRN